MTTAEDYAAMIQDAGQNTLLGIKTSIASATTLAGEQNAGIIEEQLGVISEAGLSIAEALVSGGDYEINPTSGPGLS